LLHDVGEVVSLAPEIDDPSKRMRVISALAYAPSYCAQTKVSESIVVSCAEPLLTNILTRGLAGEP
jgi:hypothetical protein